MSDATAQEVERTKTELDFATKAAEELADQLADRMVEAIPAWAQHAARAVAIDQPAVTATLTGEQIQDLKSEITKAAEGARLKARADLGRAAWPHRTPKAIQEYRSLNSQEIVQLSGGALGPIVKRFRDQVEAAGYDTVRSEYRNNYGGFQDHMYLMPGFRVTSSDFDSLAAQYWQQAIAVKSADLAHSSAVKAHDRDVATSAWDSA